MTKSLIQNISILLLLVMAFVLIPFFIFHEQFDQWAEVFVQQSQVQSLWIGIIIITLLAADILLPVPSTILSSAAGYIFGLTIGTLISFTGMTIGVLVGYWLGRGSRNKLPWLDEATQEWLSTFFQKNGLWAIAMARPVPVIAETSVIFAGMSKMPTLQFLIIAAVSNLGISVAYASLGAYSVSTNSFLLAFCGSMIIPFFWSVSKIFNINKK